MNWKHREGRVSVKAPSNIALVKYWGKRGLQLPANASLSMTLEACHTTTSVRFKLDGGQRFAGPSFFFHGKSQESFLPKINVFLERVSPLYPFLNDLSELEIHSENSFPHSSGIASSASAFAALALCLEQAVAKLAGSDIDLVRAGQAARLGSGSACRSLQGGYNLWGGEDAGLGLDENATQVKEIHPVFQDAKNAILIVSSHRKPVGSSLGHSLMNGHPFAAARVEQANSNCRRLLACLKEGDVWELGKIAESEAMTLHALKMNSEPSYTLLQQGSFQILDEIRAFRKESGVPVFFTLDAGPNPHLLYWSEGAERIERELLPRLAQYCEKDGILMDKVGEGAKVLEAQFE